jgi:hypothetical protein
MTYVLVVSFHPARHHFNDLAVGHSVPSLDVTKCVTESLQGILRCHRGKKTGAELGLPDGQNGARQRKRKQ